MATSIATGTLRPKTAVIIAGALNLVGAFLSVEVADMNINWGSLGVVAIVSLAVSVAVVALLAFAVVGLSRASTRCRAAAARPVP
jgi:phosphate/sulfate permease